MILYLKIKFLLYWKCVKLIKLITKFFIIINLVSCFLNYKHTDRLKADKRAVYKIKIDEKFINEVAQKKKSKIQKIINQAHIKLDNAIINLYYRVLDENLIRKMELKDFKSEIKKGIKFFYHYLRDEVLKDRNLFVIQDKGEKFIKEKCEKIIKSITNAEKVVNKEKQIIKVEKFVGDLVSLLNSSYSPLIVYLCDIEKRLQVGVNEGLIYDCVINNNNFDRLYNEILNAEKNILAILEKGYLFVKDGKVFMSFEGYTLTQTKKRGTVEEKVKIKNLDLYITEASEGIKDRKSFYIVLDNFIKFRLKVKDGIVYYEGIPFKLREI